MEWALLLAGVLFSHSLLGEGHGTGAAPLGPGQVTRAEYRNASYLRNYLREFEGRVRPSESGEEETVSPGLVELYPAARVREIVASMEEMLAGPQCPEPPAKKKGLSPALRRAMLVAYLAREGVRSVFTKMDPTAAPGVAGGAFLANLDENFISPLTEPKSRVAAAVERREGKAKLEVYRTLGKELREEVARQATSVQFEKPAPLMMILYSLSEQKAPCPLPLHTVGVVSKAIANVKWDVDSRRALFDAILNDPAGFEYAEKDWKATPAKDLKPRIRETAKALTPDGKPVPNYIELLKAIKP